MSTANLMKLLAAKFCPPSWALLREVGDATGGRQSRWADAVAMGIWPSRGLELHGFELKVSRSDWTKELANPAKAEAVCKYCDRWWVVAGDETIVRPGELPPAWGLMVAVGEKLKTATDAPRLEPVPIGRPFLAALMRRVHEQSLDTAERSLIERDAREQARKTQDESFKRLDSIETSRLKGDLESLRKTVREFEEASGIDLQRRWDGGKRIGAAVRRILDHGDPVETAIDNIRGIHQRLGDLLSVHGAEAR